MPRRTGGGTPSYTPTTWTKTVDGKEYEKTATSISDEVQYRYDGWRPKGKSAADAEKNAAAAAAASGSTTSPPTGSRTATQRPNNQ